MRVLILGGTGMLGSTAFAVLGQWFETFRSVRGEWDRFHTVPFVDALDLRSVRKAVCRMEPHVVLNCIGIVKSSPDINNIATTIAVNALFPHQLADICARTGTRLIHVSTDCVFSGHKGNYSEDDAPDPVDVYGRSKLLGEVDLPGCLTVRTSFIGRQAGLLRWLLDSEGEVRGYVNAIYSGFTATALCRILRDVIAYHPYLTGIYHVSGEPISKYDLLVKVRDALGLDVEVVPWMEFCCDRSLDASRFRAETGIPVPTWDEMIAELAQCD